MNVFLPARSRRLLSTMATTILCLLIPAASWAQGTPLPGLGSPALVVYDSDAVPHICTGSDRDTYYMQGYVHARDRFFQMDFLRRSLGGTVAEMVGVDGLASDVQLRTLGLRRAAERSFEAFVAGGHEELVEMLEAYSAGVNAYLSSHPLPIEYGALELTVVPAWTPVDSILLGKGVAFQLSFDLGDIDRSLQAGAYTQAGAAFGFDGLALLLGDVSRSAPFESTVTVPAASSPPPNARATTGKGVAASERAGLAAGPRTLELARRYREKAAEVSLLAEAFERREDTKGSNWWLVAGEKSTSGFAMLANDPHLGLGTPSTFYEAHLLSSSEAGCGLSAADLGATEEALVFEPTASSSAAAPAKGSGLDVTGLDVTGIGFAGAPTVVLGCNAQACWGATTNPMDVTDVYQEVLLVDPATGLPQATLFEGSPEPVQLIPQSFLVNQPGDGTADHLVDAGLGPLDGGLTVVVPRRNNGPIVQILPGDPTLGLSVQYAGWSATFELEAFRRFQRSTTVAEFRNSLQFFDVGSQNFAFANTAGEIAYFASAEMPIREDLQNLGFPDGGMPPFFIRDGTHTLQHEWLAVQNPQPQQALPFEILPFDEMPQRVDPAEGYIVNANNDPVGTTVDNDPLNQLRAGGGLYYLSPGYADGLRAGRIRKSLEAILADGGKASMRDLQDLQANNQLLDAEIVAPFLLAAYANAAAEGAPAELAALAADAGVAEAISRLMAWDYSTPTGIPEGYDPGDDPDNLGAPDADEIERSVAATIWSTYRGQLVRNVIDTALTGVGLGDFLPSSGRAYAGLANLLQTFEVTRGFGVSGVDFFPTSDNLTPEQGRDLILLQNLRGALDLLASDDFAVAFGNSADQDDYRWGYLHRIVFDHPLGGPFDVPPAGGFEHLSPELPGIARAGGFGAVDASSHSARADGPNRFMFGSGPARRFVGVLNPAGLEAEEILPGGQSGSVASPDYASQLGCWLTNRYHPLTLDPQEIAADAVSEVGFEPSCVAGATALCFGGNRFRAEVSWEAPGVGAGDGRVVPGASRLSGNFYFFDPENWEMLVKVLDGCATNGHYWVFLSPATNVGWELRVEDTFTGAVWTRSAENGDSPEVILDTTAFAVCP